MTSNALARTTAREVRSFGLQEITHRWTRGQLRSAVRAGLVARVLPGVYAAAEHSESFAVRAHAAVSWAHPEAALIGTSAAATWMLCDPPDRVTVAVPWGTGQRCPSWLRLRRIEAVPRAWAINGTRTVDAAVALATAFGQLAPTEREAPVYRAVQRRLVAAGDLARAEKGLARMGARREFRRLIDAVRAGSESHLETVSLRDVFQTQEFSAFTRQHRVRFDGRSYRLDMYDGATRTAVEIDGGTHAEPRQREWDIARDATLLAHGIATIRLSYRDVTQRPEWCRGVVRRALASRR